MPDGARASSTVQSIDYGHPATVCLYAPVIDAGDQLTEAEAATVRNSVQKRKNEFSTGRWLAHRALVKLGSPVGSLLSGPRREPIWPAGVVGSIAHTDRRAVVLVSACAETAGLGIDLEECGRLGDSLVPRILTEREQAVLGDLDPTLIFSAKEAVYKLLFPIFGEYLEFHSVEISLNPQNSSFGVEYVGDEPRYRCIKSAAGSYRQIDGCWLTGVILRHGRQE